MEHGVETAKHLDYKAGGAPRGHQTAATLDQNPIMQLQQQAGNRAVQEWLALGLIQPKLSISNPDDPEEHEAEGVAEQVMRASSAHTVSAPCACSSGVDACEECRQKQSTVSRKPANNQGVAEKPAEHSVERILSSPGAPLDTVTRAFFEPRFGRDFSNVRVHNDGEAAESARSVGALAYAAGNHVVFGQGQFSPSTHSGQRLIAHELTHTLQRRRRSPSALSTISREATPAATVAPPKVDTQSVKAAVDIITKALKGITTAGDSALILQQFQGKSPDFMRAIMQELKSRAADYDETPDGMVRWLFKDMTAEDRRSLRNLLIASHVLDDLGPILVGELVDALSSWTDSSTDVMAILLGFGAADLDAILVRLEATTKKPEAETANYLFGAVDRVSADRLRTHFIKFGGPRAWPYVADFTASKIHKLISGFLGVVSHSESTMVVNNFTAIDDPALRQLTQQELDRLTRASDSKSAEDRLMEKLDQSDYEIIQKLPGLSLRAFDRKVTTTDKVLSAAKWALMVAEWTTCGVFGIATGLLAAIWDLLKGVWDIAVAIKHLMGSLVYLLSGFTVDSEDWLAVKTFFTGIGSIFKDPGALWEQMWGQLKAEFQTIEGPFADCKRAEFIVRKFIGMVVNVVLIFLAGYGLVKAGVSAAVGFAELAEEVGVIRALGQTAAKAGRALLKFVPAKAGEVAEVAKALGSPLQTLMKVRRQINGILLAVDNEGVYAVMRNRTAGLAENEREFWRKNKEDWQNKGLKGQAKQTELETQAGTVQNALDNDQVPENGAKAVAEIDGQAKSLDKDTGALETEMKGEPEAQKADTDTTAKPGDFSQEQIDAATKRLGERIEDPKKVRSINDPKSDYDLEVDLEDGQTYRRRKDGKWCLSRNPVQCGIEMDPNIEAASERAKLRLDTEDLIDVAIEKLTSGGRRKISPANEAALRVHLREHPEELADLAALQADMPEVLGKEDIPPEGAGQRGGSQPSELGKLGKDLSRQASREIFGERWIADEAAFTVTTSDGRQVTFIADMGVVGPGGQGGLVEAKFGSGAGLEKPQEIGYPIAASQGAIPANASAERFARAAFPQWQAGQPTPPLRVRIDYWTGTTRRSVTIP